MRVELRVTGPGVVVVVRHRRHPSNFDLGDSAITRGHARSSGSHLTLEEVEYVCDRGVVRLDDPFLSRTIGNPPEHRDRLRDAEGEVETRDGVSCT